jgi:hypothetical protein
LSNHDVLSITLAGGEEEEEEKNRGELKVLQ